MTYSTSEVLKILKEKNITKNIQVLRRWLRSGELKGSLDSRKKGWTIEENDLYDFIDKKLDRLIQGGDQVLVDKIQTSILNTIPLWKNQIVIAIGLFRQNNALKIQREVTDTTNDLLKKNSEMLKQNTVGIAKESERGIIEIDTLKKVNSDLISTLEETLRIQADGREKRKQAEVELGNMEKELKEKLIQISGR